MTRKRQSGMTMWSAMFVIGVAVLFLFLFFKLFPVYLEDMKVRTALDGLAKEANVASMARAELIGRLARRFDIDNVTSIDAASMTVHSQGRSKELRFNYEVVVPLAFNISALIQFDHARTVRGTE